MVCFAVGFCVRLQQKLRRVPLQTQFPDDASPEGLG